MAGQDMAGIERQDEVATERGHQVHSTIRAWNPDAGTYGDVLLTLYAPNEPQGDMVLCDVLCKIVEMAREPIAVFFDDESVPTWTNSAWRKAS